ncbi:hypothetical protein M427DRAFT_204829 [Gonapodya prolifera JEL478]|uniref:Uncharacterized protein n=1 Tax=Gonapodya prolifera (strain JEL478) TaxID=1344416 RepID=A0A138ZZK7_GONPJ|nr:hypothetical protein M427DRAFT_204829 [Gonapodya prolifera JEL478]|eukprot:KXS09848.1 hypothetical protein M427DRAFT_204829 [Gonapodya prolifera JEL478]
MLRCTSQNVDLPKGSPHCLWLNIKTDDRAKKNWVTITVGDQLPPERLSKLPHRPNSGPSQASNLRPIDTAKPTSPPPSPSPNPRRVSLSAAPCFPSSTAKCSSTAPLFKCLNRP